MATVTSSKRQQTHTSNTYESNSTLDVVGNISTTGNILSSGANLSDIFSGGGGGSGTVTSVTAGTGMTQTGTSTVNPTLNVIGGTAITVAADSVGVTGACNTAWNAKTTCTGTVTSVSGGTGLTSSGGTTPSLSLANTCVTAGSYTSTNITVDAQGRITAASTGSGGGGGGCDISGQFLCVNGTQVIRVPGVTGSLIYGDSTAAMCAGVGNNTGVGICSMANITSGSRNTAVGFGSQTALTTGLINTSVGSGSLKQLTTGSQNTAIGGCALCKLTTSGPNVAVGNNALCNTTTGFQNVAVGYQALNFNVTGCRNVAVGTESLWKNTGVCNTGLGHNALRNNTSGYRNTAIGVHSMYYNTTGINNVAVGNGAGQYTSCGAQNETTGTSTYLGTFSTACANCGANETVIGYAALGKGSNTVTLGNASVTVVCSNGTFSTVSDRRDKTCICNIEYGLSFIQDLKPKTFNMITDRTDPEGSISCKRHGFIAQDVLALEGGDPVIIRDDDPGQLGYTGDHIIPILVKGMQEQQAIIDNLTARLEALES